MEQGIQFLEKTSTRDNARINDSTVDSLVNEYKRFFPQPEDRYLWHLVQDVQRQAMVYMNIIDQAKSGADPDKIKQRIEDLDLVPNNILPNPTLAGLVDKAFTKISKYREILVNVTRRYGMDLLKELQFEPQVTANVQVDIGFPPSLSLGVVDLGAGLQVLRN